MHQNSFCPEELKCQKCAARGGSDLWRAPLRGSRNSKDILLPSWPCLATARFCTLKTHSGMILLSISLELEHMKYKVFQVIIIPFEMWAIRNSDCKPYELLCSNKIDRRERLKQRHTNPSIPKAAEQPWREGDLGASFAFCTEFQHRSMSLFVHLPTSLIYFKQQGTKKTK